MRPKLRELEIGSHERDGEEWFHLRDREGFSAPVEVPLAFGPLLSLFDGTRDASELVRDYARRHGEELPPEWVESFIAQMDEALLLDSPHFAQFRRDQMATWNDASSRAPALAGLSYPGDETQLREYLNELLGLARDLEIEAPDAKQALEKAANPSASTCRPENTRGIVVPHIDFGRGGAVEALAYRQLLRAHRAQPFDVLVVFGIAHSGVHYPFCATSKDYETPLGTCRTEKTFVQDLVSRVGPRLKSEQWAHKSEHSIEFVATFLQHIEALSHVPIVPILCGGFFREIRSGASPLTNPDIAQFVQALREVSEQWENSGKRVGFIASVDGAHIGTPFGDETPLTSEMLEQIEADDRDFWQTVQDGELEALHAHIARDDNARNVDAHPAVWTLMAAFPELRAQLWHYAQAWTPARNEMVSFASLTLCEV